MAASWVKDVERVRVANGSRSTVPDCVVVEEPLEIRVQGHSLAVLLRTPGRDEDLATGFCLTERITTRASDIDQVKPCADAPAMASGNIVDVILVAGAKADVARFERPRFSNSACGVCGTATIDNLLGPLPPLDDQTFIASDVVQNAPEELARLQPAFRDTGGLHAAGIVEAAGALACVREDVGRHNATDKTLGAWAVEHPDDEALALVVSSRAGFEIVQKAHARRVPVIISVGAPTSLAIGLAERARITLCAFVRPGGYSIYSHAWRVR